jgi:hypothetical protein
MCDAAIMKLVGYLGQCELIVKKQLFGSFNFMGYDIMLYRCAFTSEKRLDK